MSEMGEERLIEITSEICKTNDPLWTMNYVASLGESDIYLLFKYISSSTYAGLNVYDALYNFSYDYLTSKDIVVSVDNAKFPSYGFSNNGTSDYSQSTYFSNMLEGDDAMKFVGTGKGR